jgi:hypothetical protein
VKDKGNFLKKKKFSENQAVENALKNKQGNNDVAKNIVRSKRTKKDKYFFVPKPSL